MQVLKSVGARIQPCLTPELTGKKLNSPPPHFTALSVPVYRLAISPIILVGIPLSLRISEVDVGCKQPTPELTAALYNDLKCEDTVYCGLTRSESGLLQSLVLQ